MLAPGLEALRWNLRRSARTVAPLGRHACCMRSRHVHLSGVKALSEQAETQEWSTVRVCLWGAFGGAAAARKEQFISAVYVGGSPESQKEAKALDYVGHALTVPWKAACSLHVV